MDPVNEDRADGADGVEDVALPLSVGEVEEPPAHVWSTAVAAAVTADPATAEELAALVPVADGGEGGHPVAAPPDGDDAILGTPDVLGVPLDEVPADSAENERDLDGGDVADHDPGGW